VQGVLPGAAIEDVVTTPARDLPHHQTGCRCRHDRQGVIAALAGTEHAKIRDAGEILPP
jgi:hypothetical protein